MTPARPRAVGGAWTWAPPEVSLQARTHPCGVVFVHGPAVASPRPGPAGIAVHHRVRGHHPVGGRGAAAVAWRGRPHCHRVVADRAAAVDRLAGLRRIGIDEISYRKGQRYLLCVVDHYNGRLVWAGKNRTQETLNRFFDTLAPNAPPTGTSPPTAPSGSTTWSRRRTRRGAGRGRLPCGGRAHRSPRPGAPRNGRPILRAGGHHDEAATLKGSRWALLKTP